MPKLETPKSPENQQQNPAPASTLDDAARKAANEQNDENLTKEVDKTFASNSESDEDFIKNLEKAKKMLAKIEARNATEESTGLETKDIELLDEKNGRVSIEGIPENFITNENTTKGPITFEYKKGKFQIPAGTPLSSDGQINLEFASYGGMGGPRIQANAMPLKVLKEIPKQSLGGMIMAKLFGK
ncbi:hypothetical protein KJ632_01125 [Patescibacteria group bacterium]|nr:hypothetical protein [Patescibacteria group bacterium]